MHLRPLTAADRPLLRTATLANMNWNGPRFTLADVDSAPEISHYFSSFPSSRDFGIAGEDDSEVMGVAWVVFLPAHDPGYGFVSSEIPELSITTFEGFRGRGVGTTLLAELVAEAQQRDLVGLSLSVEDENPARRLYERLGFVPVGRNGGSDTLLLTVR